MNGLLALLGLEISFRERAQYKKLGVELFQISVSFFLVVRCHAPFGLFARSRDHIFLHLVHRNTNDLT